LKNSDPAALKIGLIGCGLISRRHLQASLNVPGVEITAACSRTTTALDEVSGEYGVADLFTDWRELVRSDRIDAVLICLPDGLHEVVTVEAARRGKHVLVEKAMSRTYQECLSMVAAAEEAGIVLMVAQSTRQAASQRRAKCLIQEGRLGEITSVVRRRLGNVLDTVGDRSWMSDPELCRDLLLYGLGSHEYDALLWLFESEAREVVAKGRRDLSIWPGWIAFESTMTLRNGIACSVSMAARSVEDHTDTRIEGSEGSMTVYLDRLVVDGEEIDAPWDAVANFAAQLVEFAGSVASGREPGPSGKNGRATMAALEGLYESLGSGRPVDIPEIGVQWND
jgi:predicted dehydrogenase